MVYEKKVWKDRVKDSTGNVIQEGTPISAGNMNRIETGIADAHAQLEGAGRATQTLQHGLSVLNGNNTAPVDIQIEGRTLVSMGNTPLDSLKNYVLADKRTKLKFTNNTYQGVAKFTGENGKPQITRIANFEGKVFASTLDNPHTAKSNATKADTILLIPTSASWGEFVNGYNTISKLTGAITNVPTTANGSIAQSLFSFNVIEEVERQIGRIPRPDVAGKVQWLKDNIASFRCNWHGLGSGPTGNKATLALWQRTGNNYTGAPLSTHTSGIVTKLSLSRYSNIPEHYFNNFFEVDGFLHFLVYAEPSDGVTASSINTAYVELEMELKPDAILFDPIIPLYEVPADEYAKILVDWNEVDVLNRYPKVQGVQHLQNPMITAEGENLLPPFNEWVFNSTNIGINKPYEITISIITPGSTHAADFYLNVVPGQTYTFKGDASGVANAGLIVRSENEATIVNAVSLESGKVTFTIPAGVKRIYIRLHNRNTSVGTTTISNPILTLGSIEKPFVPRNPSYLIAQTKLGHIGTIKDLLYKQDGGWKVRKVIEKDLVLDGSLPWTVSTDGVGTKRYNAPLNNPLINSSSSLFYATDYQGARANTLNAYLGEVGTFITGTGTFAIWISDSITGFGETYAPNTLETQAFFNGWQAKAIDANGKPTTWRSLVDGADAPTQTLAYVSVNKATNFTPYKLSYPLATPRIEDVSDKVEGDISINGPTHVEVGSGAIVREKVVPVKDGPNTRYLFNDTVRGNPLKNKVGSFFKIYKNGQDDTINWDTKSTIQAFGKFRATIIDSFIDLTAEYTITYLVYDREKFTTNAINVSASYANNIRGALEDTAKKVEDTATNVSINAMLLYDVLKRLKAGGL